MKSALYPTDSGRTRVRSDDYSKFIDALLELRANGYIGDLILGAVRVVLDDPDFQFVSQAERSAWKTVAFPTLYGFTRH